MIAQLLISILLLLPLPEIPIPTFEPIPSPTPIPTSTPLALADSVHLPFDDIYNGLATVNAHLESLPNDLSDPGVAVLPADNGSQLYGYAKWMLSTTSAQEVFGSFSPIIIHIAAVITLVLFLAIVYFTIFAITYVWRFVMWVINKVIDLINLVPFI